MPRPLPNIPPAHLRSSLDFPPFSPPSPTPLPPSHYSGMETDGVPPRLSQSLSGSEHSDIHMVDDQGYQTVGKNGRPRPQQREDSACANKRQKSSVSDLLPHRGQAGLQGQQKYDQRHGESRGNQETAAPAEKTSHLPANASNSAPILMKSILILQPVDKKTSLRKLPPFQLKRDILKICNATHVRYLRFGGVAVTVESEAEAEKLRLATTVGATLITASAPKSERFCRGVINNVSPGMLCEQVKLELEEENPNLSILNVKRLGKEASNTFSIDFAGKDLPSHVYIGFWRHRVRIFYENILQC